MTNTTIFRSLALAFVLVACGKADDNSLEEKRKKLSELKTTQQQTVAAIKALESDIAKLDKQSAVSMRTIPVTASPLKVATFKHYVSVQGAIESENNVMVVPRMQGTITRVLVKEGDQVSKGQVLAETDMTILNQTIAELKSTLELVNTVYEKQKALWDEKIGSEIQFLEAKNNKEGLDKKIRTLQAQVALARVISPISGTVDDVRLKEGEAPMAPNGYIRVVNLSDMKVTARVSDAFVSGVKKGDEMSVKIPDLQTEAAAKVSFVSKVVDPVTRTFKVEATINGGAQSFRPNMLAMVKINDATKTNVIVIEENIVQTSEFGDIVFVVADKDGKKVAQLRKVKRGLSYNGKVEITEGLNVGDQLITQGYQELVDGQPVSI